MQIELMKNRKIIHIYCRSYDSYFPDSQSPYYYLAGWSSLQARNTLRCTDKYTIENWRPENEISVAAEKQVDGIKCRLFPTANSRLRNMLPMNLLRELYNEASKNHILINLHRIHNLNAYAIVGFFRNLPIVSHHHGEIPPTYKRAKNQSKALLVSVKSIMEKKILKWVDYFSVVSSVEKRYLETVVGPDKVALEAGRVFFDEWKPVAKRRARLKLGIPVNKKVIIYVGKYYSLKGVDSILEIYPLLKKMYDLELLLIGGSASDPLYGLVKSLGIRHFGRLAHDELPLFYSAADLYLAPAFAGTWVPFGGLSTAIIEALACNIPVVTKQLIHFPTDEWSKVGLIPKDKNDVVNCISQIFENPSAYANCREVARKYYDLAGIMNRTIMIYDNLFEQYYGGTCNMRNYAESCSIMDRNQIDM